MKKRKKIPSDFIFPTRLKNLMRDNKVTQQQLAEAIGVTRQATGNWLNGNTVPDMLSFWKIADFFNISADSLLGRNREKTTENDILIACDITGLSVESVKRLNDMLRPSCRKTIDEVIKSIIKNYPI